MITRTSSKKARVATHRPAVKPRRFRHDEHTAVDLFSGFGDFGIRNKDAGCFEKIPCLILVEVHASLVETVGRADGRTVGSGVDRLSVCPSVRLFRRRNVAGTATVSNSASRKHAS